jgi:hypothetical protein
MAPGQQVRERRVAIFGFEVLEFADVFQTDVAQQSARQQAGFRQDLKSVTDAEDQAASFSKFRYGIHDRREFGKRSSAEVVAIGESAGQNDSVEAFDVCVLVPDVFHRFAEHGLNDVVAILFAIRTGENNDAELHMFEITPR